MNDTAGVALMVVAWLLVLRKIKGTGLFYRRVMLPVSKASYGMYLCHMFVLGAVVTWLRSTLGVGPNGTLGIWTTPVEILTTAMGSFVIVAAVGVAVQRIPRVGKWLMG